MKEDLLYVLEYVFEHYLDSDLEDEHREEVENAFNSIKIILDNGGLNEQK